MLNKHIGGLVQYSQSPLFCEKTVPAALQRNHRTKAGVWARAIVLEGSIDYVLEEKPQEKLTVDAGNFALIEPQVPHHVCVTGPVSFQLQFYRKR